jgi:phosphoglycerate dehydrogenase-like enzyme
VRALSACVSSQRGEARRLEPRRAFASSTTSERSSANAPMTAETRHALDSRVLSRARPGLCIVNPARGGLIDQEALLAALDDGRVAGAVLDVTDPEPLPTEHPLRFAQGVLALTPHIAGDSDQAVLNAAHLAGDQLSRWLAGEPLLNVVRQGTRHAPASLTDIAGPGAGAHAHEGVDHDRT